MKKKSPFKLKPIILTVEERHKAKTWKVLKLRGWCYNGLDYMNNKISAIHKFISANCL